MITLIADRYQAVAPLEGALAPASAAEYVAARIQLRRALDTQSDLTIYLRDPVLLHCFEDLQRYPRTAVVWLTIDPAQDFERFFGVAPAAPFTPERIVALRLEAMRPPPEQARVDPLSWALGEQVGELWRYEVPPAQHLGELVAWAVSAAPLADPTLRVLAAEQLARWSACDQRYAALRTDTLTEDATAIIVHTALRSYDPAWRVAQPWGAAPTLDQAPPARIAADALRSLHAAIGQYWRERYAASGRDAATISIALAQMSGRSESELEELAAILAEHPEQLTAALIQRIRRCFEALPAAARMLNELKQRVEPPMPSEPEPSWTTERWLGWASREYLRYFAWVIRSGADRTMQQTLATCYSDWLYEHYPAMLRDDQAPLITGQFSRLRELLDDDPRALVVWLVVDGLTWWQGERMLAACEGEGLYVQAYQPGIAILPSITSISKRALVTGVPARSRTEPSVAAAARVQFERAGIRAFVTYTMDDALARIRVDRELRCVLALYNTIDVLSHQTTRFTDDPGIFAYLDELARTLGRLRDAALGQGRSFHALIGSDHGSTLLPDDSRSLPLPPLATEIEDPWEPQPQQASVSNPSPRAAVIASPERIAADERGQWYVLDRQRFDLDQHYLVPRRAHYIGRRPAGWTHGGLTPEETIVPMLHLALKRIELVPLALTLEGMLRARQETSVTLRIVNPNRMPIDDLAVVLGQGIAPVKIEQIAPLGRVELALIVPATTTSAAELSVDWQVSYSVIGASHEQLGRALLPIRRLQTVDSGFDDFFTEP